MSWSFMNKMAIDCLFVALVKTPKLISKKMIMRKIYRVQDTVIEWTSHCEHLLSIKLL